MGNTNEKNNAAKNRKNMKIAKKITMKLQKTLRMLFYCIQFQNSTKRAYAP